MRKGELNVTRYCNYCKNKTNTVQRVKRITIGAGVNTFYIDVFCVKCGRNISSLPEICANAYNYANSVLSSNKGEIKNG